MSDASTNQLVLFKVSDIDSLLKENYQGLVYYAPVSSIGSTQRTHERILSVANNFAIFSTVNSDGSGTSLQILESVFLAKTDLGKSSEASTGWDMSVVRWFVFIGAFAVVGAYQYFKWQGKKNYSSSYKKGSQGAA